MGSNTQMSLMRTNINNVLLVVIVKNEYVLMITLVSLLRPT